MPKCQKLTAKDGTAVEVTRCEVVRDPSSPTGWFARGVTTRGGLVRFVVPGAQLDGVALTVPDADGQRKLAAESTPWEPGKSKPAAKAKPAK